MPKVFAYNGFKFHFFSNEGDPLEPLHIHVRKAGNHAKIWIEPELELADNCGFSPREIRTILEQVQGRAALIRRKWNEHFD